MTNLVISNVVIKQDENLRYRLNDLHKASGLPKTKAPSEWMRNQTTLDLIATYTEAGILGAVEFKGLQPIEVVLGIGKNQGTFAVKQLVYAYAMWLSPKFHLHVIDAYDAVVNAEREELKWLIARGGTKQEYKNMTLALKNYYSEKGETPPQFAYSNDADMLNLIVLGMRAKQFKQILQLDTKASIRDYLNDVQLSAFEYLETRNAGYLDDGLEYTERAIKLKGLFDKRFKDKILLSLDNETNHNLLGA